MTDRHEADEFAPLRGWHPGMIETRFVPMQPKSYDKGTGTVETVISVGSPVKRFYGTETLRIHKDAVDLTRMSSVGIPVLDSHSQNSITDALGRVRDVWISRGTLVGLLAFNRTEEGHKAEGMVSRGEISGISAGYRVEEWEITDKDGRVIDPEVDRIRLDDDLNFMAKRWELLEASLVAVPADASASMRAMKDHALPVGSIFRPQSNSDVATRMRVRQLMYEKAKRSLGYGYSRASR